MWKPINQTLPVAVVLAGSLWLGTGAHAAPLQGSEWKPLLIGDNPVAEASQAFIQFRSKGRLVGHGGCNRLFAEYQAGDGHIFIGPVAATRMACPEDLMTTEAALAQALEQARSYQRMQTKLVLFGSDGKPLLEMRQTDWD
jgi:heat shock protein HslJ